MKVRFSVTLETMVVEKELNVDNRDYYMSLVNKGDSSSGSSSRFTSPWGATRDGEGGGRRSGGGNAGIGN